MAMLTRGKSKNRAAKAKLAERPSKASAKHPRPNAIGELRKQLQLSQSVFARLLPVSLRTLATLESGRTPTDVVDRRLIELRRLTNALGEVIKKDSIGKWLQTPIAAFDELKPLEVIERGESDRIWSMIYFLRSGAPA